MRHSPYSEGGGGYAEPNFPRKHRMYRSTKDKVFFGVCGGIAEHFDFSPWGVRCIVILMTITTAVFPLALFYVILGFAIKQAPERRFSNYDDEEFWNTFQSSRGAALRKVHRHFQLLEKRLQRMESIVTSPSFETEDEYRNL